MIDFKGRHFGGEIELWAVRWYCRYPVSYHNLETMMTERGVRLRRSCSAWLEVNRPRHDRNRRIRSRGFFREMCCATIGGFDA